MKIRFSVMGAKWDPEHKGNFANLENKKRYKKTISNCIELTHTSTFTWTN